jgi:hypothetical protein
MRDFLQAVSAEYDIVLIDTPPILPVTDSAIVAGQVDGVLLVYQHHLSPGEHNIPFYIGEKSKGFYSIIIHTGGQTIVKKLAVRD